mmetsp:Transcript_17434/g.46475  ORF Transcript_17434/g.46475 Transcript_17434/m.46475 type:complete len:206 (-) Transcript_17434:1209-1826(-)
MRPFHHANSHSPNIPRRRTIALHLVCSIAWCSITRSQGRDSLNSFHSFTYQLHPPADRRVESRRIRNGNVVQLHRNLLIRRLHVCRNVRHISAVRSPHFSKGPPTKHAVCIRHLLLAVIAHQQRATSLKRNPFQRLGKNVRLVELAAHVGENKVASIAPFFEPAERNLMSPRHVDQSRRETVLDCSDCRLAVGEHHARHISAHHR